MGMSVGAKKGGVQSEINVTPLIDVLLVLLIIFLVVMPIMMKMETLQVPRKIQDNEDPDPNASLLTVKVDSAMGLVLNDGNRDYPCTDMPDLKSKLVPKLDAMHAGTEKVVFVDFNESIPWELVISTMDTIRSIATDDNHDEIKVALKVADENAPKQ
ncbi:MAG TPA: biopolymer transporter ExbD [Kofleriaceae bacterium]|nr:biopolymer transporter ExbD [Kofleriaceae bacterium]